MRYCTYRENTLELAKKTRKRKAALSKDDEVLKNHIVNCQRCKETFATEQAFQRSMQASLGRSFA